MREAFFQGFGFAAGAIIAVVVFLFLLGAWDWFSGMFKTIKLHKNLTVLSPGDVPEGVRRTGRIRSI